jgi:hypothetical protein
MQDVDGEGGLELGLVEHTNALRASTGSICEAMSHRLWLLFVSAAYELR